MCLHPGRGVVGYSIVWDNTQKLTHVRDCSRKSGNRMFQWANAYAARGRVAVDASSNVSRLWARDIPLTTYLPDDSDYQALQQRMTTVVCRILQHHVNFFSRQTVVRHIPHQYAAESAVKSELVGLCNVADVKVSPPPFLRTSYHDKVSKSVHLLL